nr:hypothetical protein [Tanacetum cinerariifolium]
MGNLGFIDMFLGVHVVFQPYRYSDHAPAILKFPNLVDNKPQPFKFFNFWLIRDQGNLHDRVSKLRIKLDEVQKALDKHPDDIYLRDEEAVYIQAFSDAKLDEDWFLKQKRNVDWLEAGDANTAYFHKTIKSDNYQSRIMNVLNYSGIEVIGPTIPEVFVSHYEQFLGSSMQCEDLDITESGWVYIWFFKKGWDIVGRDVYNAARDVFSNGQILKEINHTFLALIPKEVVSENQSAFVSGRRISDNILNTHELMHNYHRDRSPPRCAFKVITTQEIFALSHYAT